MHLRTALAATLAFLAPLSANAEIALYSDATAFLSDTSATSATGTMPTIAPTFSATVGSVSFSGSSFYIGGYPWTTLIAGEEIAINGVENLDVGFAAPVYSAGFEYADPLLDANSPYVGGGAQNATFSVTLKLGGSTVDSFQFSRPENVSAFVGVWSTAAFDRMEIREQGSNVDDEYFGQFYTGTVPMPVPEPETWGLLAAGLGLLAARLRGSANRHSRNVRTG
jgi:hypothetical protein